MVPILTDLKSEGRAALSLEESQFVLPEYSKRISMEFKDAELNDVLRILSHQSGLNFIAAEAIGSKKVTLFLKDVPVEEALERILHANALTYEVEPGSGIFIVKSVTKPEKELLTRIYRLKHATVSSSKLNKTITIESESGSEDGSSASPSTQTSGSAEGIVNALKAILTESGKIVEDPRTNGLIVTDIPSQFPLIERTLSRLDVPVSQVLIEVEMLDISKKTADKIGVKIGDTPLTFKGAERDHVYPWDQNKLLGKGFTFASPEYRVGTISAAGLSATLQFLRTQGDTRNLARPRILTLNNETAQIKITTDEAIGIKTQTQSAEGSSTQSKEAERVETGISLTVTPQANLLTGEITMAIVPKVIQARTGATFEGTTFRDPEERGSQSIMKVSSGDTIVIAGLLRTDLTETITKVPFLGDIPIVGAAFRHKDRTEEERELIIFITPHIIGDDAASESLTKRPLPHNPIVPQQGNPSPSRDKEVEKALSNIERNGL